MAKYSKDSIIQILQDLAERLGRKNLSGKDIATVIPPSTVIGYFGNIGNALEAAGLQRTAPGAHFRGRGNALTDDQLFQALLKVEQKLGKEPGFNDCSAFCEYSIHPYRGRFRKWQDVLAHYRKWKTEHPESMAVADNEQQSELVLDNSSTVHHDQLNVPVRQLSTRDGRKPKQLYGEPIDFRGLRHAPINEQGVVFLFGMVSRELGFNIESVQQGFPDCEGKYLHDEKRNLWAKARIEFEYKASNFVEHGHDPQQCDFIVCWENDWPESPIDVIQLKTELLKLPNR